jgi:hypothetical protein
MDELFDNTFPFADDNTFLLTDTNVEHLKQELLHKLMKVKEIYQEIDATLSLPKTICIPLNWTQDSGILANEHMELQCRQEHKILGIILDSQRHFQTHANTICVKAGKNLHWLQSLKNKLTLKQRRTCFKLYVESILDYSIPVITPYLKHSTRRPIDSLLKAGVRFITKSTKTAPPDLLQSELGLVNIQEKMYLHQLKELKQRNRNDLSRRKFIQILNLRSINKTPKVVQKLTKLRKDLPPRFQALAASPILDITSSFANQKWKKMKRKILQFLRNKKLDNYEKRFPERAYRFDAPRLRKLTDDEEILLRLRTEQARTADWLFRHNLIQEPKLCRYCGIEKETLPHLFCSCNKILLARLNLLKAFPTLDQHQAETAQYQHLMTRSPDKKEQLIQESAIVTFVRAIKLDL